MRYTIEHRTAGRTVWSLTVDDKIEALNHFFAALVDTDKHTEEKAKRHGDEATALVISGKLGSHSALTPDLTGTTELIAHR